MTTSFKPSVSWKLKLFLTTIMGILLVTSISYGLIQAPTSEAILQGTIEIRPSAASLADKEKIQPGTAIKISVNVQNVGDFPSEPGEIFIQYGLAKPLHKEEGSVLFETEKKILPVIEPHQSVVITFDQSHSTPTLLDFVRDDWALREYQAVVNVNQETKMIGTLALTFSAYYYPGVVKQFPKKFMKKDVTEETN